MSSAAPRNGTGDRRGMEPGQAGNGTGDRLGMGPGTG